MATRNNYHEGNLTAYLTIMWLFVLVGVCSIIRRYANPNLLRWYHGSLIFVAYFAAGCLLFTIPLDVALTIVARDEKTNTNADKNYQNHSDELYNVYTALFWPMFALGSLGLVWLENYVQDGHTTVIGRIFGATHRLIKMWAVLGTVGAILLISLVASGAADGSAQGLRVTCIVLSNTYGLVAITVLLGYGMVEFPKITWRISNLDYHLLKTQMRAAVEFKRLSEASLQVSMTVADVYRTNEEVQRGGDVAMKEAIKVVVADCPSEFTSGTMGTVQVDKEGKITEHTLADLRRRLNIDRASFRMCQGRVERIKRLAYYLEDVINSRSRSDGLQRVKWSFGVPESSHYEWWWHTHIRPGLLKVLSVCSATLSLFTLLGCIGLMAGYTSNVSVFAVAVHDPAATAGGITIFVVVTLGYVCYTTMWSLFQMRIANMMEIVPDQRTTPKSLSFNARQVARLSAPLVFFYLGLIFESGVHSGSWQRNESDKRIDTSFSQFYGEAKIVPFLGDQFNIFFPVIILVMACFQGLNLLNRGLVWAKLGKYQFGDIEVTDDQLKEGRRQLQRYRKQMERTVQRDQTRDKINRLKRKSVIEQLVMDGRTRNEEITKQVMTSALDAAPPRKNGWMEKKSKKNKIRITAGWRPRYFEIHHPGHLNYYKSEPVSSADPPLGVVDLRLVMSIRNSSKKGLVDATRLDLDLGDTQYKLRCETAELATEWREALLMWKDYAIDHGHEAPALAFDQDDETASGNGSPEKGMRHQAAMGAASAAGGGDESEDDGADEETGLKTPFSARSPMSNRAAAKDGRTPGADGSGGLELSRQAKPSDVNFDEQPEMLVGYLHKKSHANKLHPWHQRYFEIDTSTGSLTYWKTNDTNRVPQGAIDLTLVSDVEYYEKDGKVDRTRFNVNLDVKVVKLRARNEREAERWVNGLNAWREYFLLNLHSTPFSETGSARPSRAIGAGADL